MHNNETPTLPYCMNGIKLHKISPCVQVPCMKRNALNGRTITQNKQSAIHKLQVFLFKTKNDEANKTKESKIN